MCFEVKGRILNYIINLNSLSSYVNLRYASWVSKFYDNATPNIEGTALPKPCTSFKVHKPWQLATSLKMVRLNPTNEDAINSLHFAIIPVFGI